MEVVSKIENLDLKKQILLPSFPLPEKFKTGQEFLEDLTWKEHHGAIAKSTTRYTSTDISYELGIIQKTGFAGYFLIVQDFINAARELGVWVGPGRGSRCRLGSGILYRHHDVDPNKV
jgi:DNA polymerase-3 subunit alpha